MFLKLLYVSILCVYVEVYIFIEIFIHHTVLVYIKIHRLHVSATSSIITSNSALLHYNINSRIRTALRTEHIRILYSTNNLHHTIIKHLHNFKGVLDNVTNGPVPQQPHSIYLLKIYLTFFLVLIIEYQFNVVI
jgi:hypothetical protein